jgi:hypothetical protein
LIERLQREVELLRRLNQVDMTEALLRRNRVLEEEVQALRRAFHLQTGREYPLPSTFTIPFLGPNYPRKQKKEVFFFFSPDPRAYHLG